MSETAEILDRAFDLIRNYLDENARSDAPVVRYRGPRDLRDRLDLSLGHEGVSDEELVPLLEQYLENSVRTGHRQFLNQLYGGQEKYALLEVRVPAAGAGESRELAVARVTYENPFNRRKESASGRAVARFSRDLEESERSANAGVERSLQINLDAKAREQAIDLADEGRNEEAAQVLKDSARRLEAVGLKFDDRELLRRAEKIEEEADTIEADGGMSAGKRKALRASSFQDKNQQISR